MNFDDLIFDRSQADLSNNTSKAYYNVSDLQRVNAAIQDLSAIFIQISATNYIQGKTTWDVWDFTKINTDTLLSNLQIVRDVFELSPYTPEIPESLDKITLEIANDLEQILHDIYNLGDLAVTNNNEQFVTSDDQAFLYSKEV